MKKYILKFCCFFLLISVFYFSWLPNPEIGSKSYFPKAIGHWINYYGNLRTAVPFALLGGLGEFFIKKNGTRPRLVLLGLLLLIVTVAELGQLVLPKRHFDWADIGWGAVGSVVGIAVAVGFKRVFTFSTT